ncbi:MAG: hypothetical protein ACR2FS_05040 [Phormidesmis sp.]
MIIQSVFARDNEAAIFGLEATEDKISLIDSWRSSPHDKDINAAALACYSREALFAVSPVPGTTDSYLKTLLSREGLDNIKVCREFAPIQALAAMQSLNRTGKLDTTGFAEWPRLEAEISRSDKTPSVWVMALLQGVLEAEIHCHKPMTAPIGSLDLSYQRAQQAYGRLAGILGDPARLII